MSCILGCIEDRSKCLSAKGILHGLYFPEIPFAHSRKTSDIDHVFDMSHGPISSTRLLVNKEAEDIQAATQFTGALQPITQGTSEVERVEITEEMADFNAYDKLRVERTSARYIGKKTKKEIAAEEAAKKPKAGKKKKK